MSRLATRREVMAAWVVTACIIVYGSLYPFDFRVPDGGAGAWATLLGRWDERPGRGDFLSNILLYVPFGFFGVLAVSKAWGTAGRAALATLLGAGLSVCVELTQYFDAGRYTTATDVYANAAGTALGALAGCVGGVALRRPSLGRLAADPFPVLLLVGWLASRLYPFVPAVELRKYWHALKPVVLHPELAPNAVYRHTVVWLLVGALVHAVAGRGRSGPAFVALAGGVLLAEMAVVGKALSAAEVAGAGAALCLAALGVHRRAGVVAGLLAVAIVAQRLEPFQFHWPPGRFGLVPFLGFMRGSIDVNVASFLQKVSLYGGLVWSLVAAGWRVRSATAAVVAGLLLTGLVQTMLPGRSADVTDAVLALAAGAVLASLRGSLRRGRAVWDDGTSAAQAPARGGP